MSNKQTFDVLTAKSLEAVLAHSVAIALVSEVEHTHIYYLEIPLTDTCLVDYVNKKVCRRMFTRTLW
jgi:hypothetical protein